MTSISKKIEALDDYGRLTEPMPKDAPMYNFREIRNYCRKNNKGLADLTHKEFEMFRTDK